VQRDNLRFTVALIPFRYVMQSFLFLVRHVNLIVSLLAFSSRFVCSPAVYVKPLFMLPAYVPLEK
jgi:hypothetical protein